MSGKLLTKGVSAKIHALASTTRINHERDETKSPDIALNSRRDSLNSEFDILTSRNDMTMSLHDKIAYFSKNRDRNRRRSFRKVVILGTIIGAFGLLIYFIDLFLSLFSDSYPRLLSLFIGGISILIIDVAIIIVSTVPVDLLDMDKLMETSKYRWLRFPIAIFLIIAVYNQNIKTTLSVIWWIIEILIAISVLYTNDKYSWNRFSFKLSLFFLLMPFGLALNFATRIALSPESMCPPCLIINTVIVVYFFVIGSIQIYLWYRVLIKEIQARANNANNHSYPTALLYMAGYGILVICGPFNILLGYAKMYFENLSIEGAKQIFIGISFLTPPILVMIVTRDWLFSFMSRRFDRNDKNLQQDGAFIAELLAMEDFTVGEDFYIHRGRIKVNYRYPPKDPLRFYRKGKIVEMDRMKFYVALNEETIEIEEPDGEHISEILPSKVVCVFNGQVIDKKKELELKAIGAFMGKLQKGQDVEQWPAHHLALNVNSKDLLEWAHKNLRCIDWEELSEDLFMRSSIRTTGEQVVDYYSHSRFLKPDEKRIDFFISHAWTDDGKSKFQALKSIAEAFHVTHKRWPTFWFDKVCFDQNNLNAGLKVLPINIMSCETVLVLCGPNYPSRLWCIWELFTLFAFIADDNEAIAKVQLVPLSTVTATASQSLLGVGTVGSVDTAGDVPLTHDSTDILKLHKTEDDVISQLKNFKLSESTCYDPNEKKKLLRVIKAVGESIFEERIHKLAVSCELASHKLRRKNPDGTMMKMVFQSHLKLTKPVNTYFHRLQILFSVMKHPDKELGATSNVDDAKV